MSALLLKIPLNYVIELIMYYIRPIKESDLPRLLDFAKEADLGMRSLPKDKKLLEEKIASSINTFQGNINPQKSPMYLFVLEGIFEKTIIGCAGIVAKTGVDRPLCHYRLEIVPHISQNLKLVEKLEILRPETAWEGPSELISLYIEKKSRHLGLAQLLSLSRLLFATQFPQLFAPKVIARLRGIVDSQGESIPFWEEIGSHFCLHSAKELLEKLDQNKQLIQELLPPYPIYTSMLSKKTRELFRKVHRDTMPAFKMLSEQGFTVTDCIDVIDGGPTIEVKLEDSHLYKNSRLKMIESIKETDDDPKETVLISNLSKDFRCCITEINPHTHNVQMPAAAARALNVQVKDQVRIIGI